MKVLASLITMLTMAGLPLTAAALDYGPSQRFLAAETHAPSLTAPAAEAAPFAYSTSRHAGGATGASDPPQPPATQSTARRKPSPAIPAPGAGGVEPPPRGASPLSWQSLLPGSIQ
ncbi:MAG: hypothetical protein JSS21_04655 [Proteobacteria bacterium]|nr:hypothetical protein [Pseudomonadota bacterium]